MSAFEHWTEALRSGLSPEEAARRVRADDLRGEAVHPLVDEARQCLTVLLLHAEYTGEDAEDQLTRQSSRDAIRCCQRLTSVLNSINARLTGRDL